MVVMRSFNCLRPATSNASSPGTESQSVRTHVRLAITVSVHCLFHARYVLLGYSYLRAAVLVLLPGVDIKTSFICVLDLFRTHVGKYPVLLSCTEGAYRSGGADTMVG